MEESRHDLLYRKINRLTAALVASMAVLVLLMAIALILVNSRIDRTREQVGRLALALAERQEPSTSTPTAPGPPLRASFSEQVNALQAAMDAVTTQPSDRTADLEQRFKQLDAMASSIAGIDADTATTFAALAERLGDPDRTLRWARNALTADADSVPARMIAATALRTLGQNKDALAELDRVLRTDENVARAHWMRAEILDALGQSAHAVRAYTTAQQFPETAVAATIALVRLLLSRKELDAAALAIGHAQVAEDATPELVALRGELAARRGQFDDAVNWLSQAEQQFELAATSRIWLGRAQLETGDLDAARETFAALAAEEPDRPEGWYWQAVVSMRQLRWAEATTLLHQAIAVDASFVPAFEDLGVALTNDHRVDEAVKVLSDAVKLDESSGRAHFLLAICHAKRDHRDAAWTALQRAVALDANYLQLAREAPVFETLGIERLSQ